MVLAPKTLMLIPLSMILYTLQRPTTRAGRTRVIANDRGHLLPEAARSQKSPWGDFVGTWQQEPKQVQLRVRTKMVNPRVTVDTSWKRNNPLYNQTDLEKKATPAREEVANRPGSKSSALHQSIESPKPEVQNDDRPASNESQRTTSRQSVESPKPELQNGSRPTSNVSQRTTSRQSVESPKPELQNGSRPTSNVSQRTTSRQSVRSPKPDLQNNSRPASNVSQRTTSRQSVTSPSPAPGDSRGHLVGSMHGSPPLPQSPVLLEES